MRHWPTHRSVRERTFGFQWSSRRAAEGPMATAPPTSDAPALPLADRTIGEVSDLLRARKLSSVELVGACLEGIARDGERLNTFLAVGDEAALEAAREADRALAGGDERPLLGIPCALKDIFVTR